MRSHVLTWLWLCFAIYCSIGPNRASANVNRPILTYSAVRAVQQQPKDTTVKPSASPIVITPSASKPA
ncbi:hypothetical protein, partial [Chitinophaga sancti]